MINDEKSWRENIAVDGDKEGIRYEPGVLVKLSLYHYLFIDFNQC